MYQINFGVYKGTAEDDDAAAKVFDECLTKYVSEIGNEYFRGLVLTGAAIGENGDAIRQSFS